MLSKTRFIKFVCYQKPAFTLILFLFFETHSKKIIQPPSRMDHANSPCTCAVNKETGIMEFNQNTPSPQLLTSDRNQLFNLIHSKNYEAFVLTAYVRIVEFNQNIPSQLQTSDWNRLFDLIRSKNYEVFV